ncbi:MAG: amino acid adenylation domain-containing protein [Candidatus Omnitrophota bacterium]
MNTLNTLNRLDKIAFGAAHKKEENYWLNRLAERSETPSFPLDYKQRNAPETQDASPRSIRKLEFVLPEDSVEKIIKLSAGSLPRQYMVLTSGIIALIKKYTGQEEITLGMPIFKQAIETDLINTLLVLKTRLTPHITFKELLLQVRQTISEAVENQNYPIEMIVQKLKIPYTGDENFPLFDTAVLLDNIQERKYLEGIRLNMIFSFQTTGRSIHWNVEYNEALFDKRKVEQIAAHFHLFLRHVLSDPGQPISRVLLLTEEEKKQLLGFCNNPANYPESQTIRQLFEAQVETMPERISVMGPSLTSGAYLQLSARELNEKANRLAVGLRQKNIGPNKVVGIILERSVEMIISILGIVKAGGVYLPLDPGYPVERIDFILKDSSASVLISTLEIQGKIEPQVKNHSIEIIDINALLSNFSTLNPNVLNPNPWLQPHDPAYVIYTSGTTGRPKGVIIEHTHVVRLFFNDRCLYDFNENDVWTMFHSYCFDFSVWEMYGALLYGGKLIIIPKIMAQDPRAFLTILKEKNVTILNQTPSAFYNLINEALNDQEHSLYLRYVIFGGEALSPIKLKEWKQKYPGTKLVNMFGITETTVHVTYKEIDDKEIDSNISCIGKPIPTLSTYLLDSGLSLLPPGIPGELCVGGCGVGRGYLNRPELTHEKFISNPFKKDERLYRSGDLAKFSADGELEYLGRIDHQVQIRGFRVERGEIESRLSMHPDIHDAVVLASEDKGGNPFLTAYMVSDVELSVSQLREFLSTQLPDYMIPSYFMRIPRIPLTSNGKIDKEKLPEPKAAGGEAYTPPRNKIEEGLIAVWREVLDAERIGINDNFFNIGGDSIKAIRLISLINNRLVCNIKLVDLFTHNNIKELAQFVADGTDDSYDNSYNDNEWEEVREEVEELKKRVMASGKVGERVEDVFPMSDIEKGMIFHSYRNPDKAIYHDQFVYQRKYNSFDPGLFRKALELMVGKHSALRVSYNVEDFDEFVHFVHQPFPAVYKHFDVRGLNEQVQAQHVAKYMEEDRKERWDITTPPLWRMATFDFGDDNICAVWTFHHAILDGWSNASLMTELNNTYLELKSDNHYIPPMLKISYKEFIHNEIVEKRKVSNIDFWKRELEGYKRVPFSAWGESETDEVRRRTLFLNQNLTDCAKYYNTSVKHIGFAAYVFMLSMLTYENDVVVGLISNNRPEVEDGDKLIGCFLNTVPFRLRIPTGITYTDYIHLVNEKLVELKPYERMTFYEIVKIIGESNRSGNAVFDTIFYYIDFHIYKEVTVEAKQGASGGSRLVQGYERTNTLFDFTVSPYLNGIRVGIRHSTSVITEDVMEKLCGYFLRFIEKVISEPNAIIKKAELISDPEKQELLYKFNNSNNQYPKDKTIYQLFEAQALRAPDHIAVIGSRVGALPPRSTQLTYRELNHQVTRLADEFLKRGILPDTIVGIMIERCIEMIIAIFGILKAGGAYLPIDPAYPKDRIDYMLTDSGAKFLFLTEHTEDTEGKRLETELLLATEVTEDTERGVIKGEKVKRLEGKNVSSLDYLTFLSSYLLTYPFLPSSSVPSVCPVRNHSSLAYIIYTSGSTGKPKGVMVEHASAVNLLYAMQTRYPLGQSDTYLLKTSYIFDVSVTELFGWYMGGGRLALLEKGGEKVPGMILDAIERHTVSHINFVPSMFNAFIDYLTIEDKRRISRLRYIFLAGEALLKELVKKFDALNTSVRVENIYGPTEGTVYASWYSLSDRGNSDRIPIGKPVSNVTLYIVDKQNHWQPLGVAGELCISGKGLARGYLNCPELTLERFMSCRLSVGGFRLYKTGDLARWLPDGNIEFLGRIDHQVKIRGFRIELGEIETRLIHHPDIKEAVALAKTDERTDNSLHAYIVAERDIAVAELREYLSKYIPDYMVPSYFYRIEKIPLTFNGKIDHHALHALTSTIKSNVEYAAPTNHTEERIVEIWKKILRIDRIGIHDNFFELGGHSLEIIKVIFAIKQAFDVEIPVPEMLMHPTIKRLSASILRQKHGEEINAVIEGTYVRLSNAGEKQRNIFCFPPGIGVGVTYINLARQLEGYNIYAFNFLDEDRLFEEYADKIMEIQEKGPYYLFGYSGGGNLAFGTARELEQRGEMVSDIIMLDSFYKKVVASPESIRKSEEDAANFADSLVSTIEELGLGPMKEKIMEKARRCHLYSNNRMDHGTVNAHIHLIVSADRKETKTRVLNTEMGRAGLLINMDWEEASGDRTVYEGFGIHADMLNRTLIEKNVVIIRKILESS